MELDIEVLKECCEEATDEVESEAERLKNKLRGLNGHIQLLHALRELLAKNDRLNEELERKQSEIDDLSEQLDRKDAEIDSLRMQLLDETGDLRQQLLNAKEQTLEVTTKAKPMEIHNHFESGSNSQVFNDKVKGRFTKNKDKKKKEKKRWKRLVGKVL